MARDIEKKRRADRDYYHRHRDAIKERCGEYFKEYRANPENKRKRKKYLEKYYAISDNKKRHNEKSKRYYKKNKERILELGRKRYRAKKTEIAKYHAHYYKNNKEKVDEQNRRWRINNYDKWLSYGRNYFCKRDGDFSYEEWLMLQAEYDNKCAYCGKITGLTIDHVVPISRGGEHDIGNVLPSCHSCNSKKGTKLLSEWKPEMELVGLS